MLGLLVNYQAEKYICAGAEKNGEEAATERVIREGHSEETF